MINKVPQENKKYQQSNGTDRLGNISRTKNISFDKPGSIKLENRLRSFTNDILLADFSSSAGNGAVGFSIDGGNIYAYGTKNIYKSLTTAPTVFTKNADTGFPTLDTTGENDMIEFDAQQYVAYAGTLARNTGSAWTNVSSVLDPVILCRFENLNQLACGGNNIVELIDTARVVQTTLTLPDDFSVVKMTWANQRLFIATRSARVDGKAILFEWDGLSASANAGYEVPKGHTIYSVKPYKNGVVVVTSAGQLLYNAGGWQELDNFPIYYKNNIIWDSAPTATNTSRRICHNGMAVDGDKIYIGINSSTFETSGNRNAPRFFQDFPNGVWCYEPEVGLHHKWSIDSALASITSTIATTSVNTTTDVITVAGATVPATGTPVFYYNSSTSSADSSSATPLTHGTCYYTIYQSGTTLKLATTKANANAGTAINLTGTGNNAQYLVFVPEDSMGSIKSSIQALIVLDNTYSQKKATSVINRIMVGGVTMGEDGTVATYLATSVTDQANHGYVVYSRHESENIEDSWQKAYLKFKKLRNPDDRIIVKYGNRDNELPDYETTNIANSMTHTWVDGNTYTTTQDLSAIKARYDDDGLMDEVEITYGKGAGHTAHISSITESGGTYTVNLDETIPDVTAGDKLRVVYYNWIKIDEINYNSPTNESGWGEFALNHNSVWNTIKIDLIGIDIEVTELQVASQIDKSSQVYN